MTDGAASAEAVTDDPVLPGAPTPRAGRPASLARVRRAPGADREPRAPRPLPAEHVGPLSDVRAASDALFEAEARLAECVTARRAAIVEALRAGCSRPTIGRYACRDGDEPLSPTQVSRLAEAAQPWKRGQKP